MKIYTNGLGHMIKIVPMLIYGHPLEKSSPEPEGQWPWDLVLGYGAFQVCSNDDPRLTFTYFMALPILIPNAFILKKYSFFP